MQQAIDSAPQQAGRGGGRASSEEYRTSLRTSGDFCGLEEETSRYDLLLLVKRVGKAAGYTPRMIQLLDYYIAFTRDVDWEAGSRPIVFQSVAKTALDLGVSERQVQNLERRLFAAGAITWNDSGNHKRFGKRDPVSQRLVYAFGVELTPLAFIRKELENKLHEKQLRDQAWMEAKRSITWFRRQIRSMLIEIGEGPSGHFASRYDEIAVQLRTHMPLEAVRALLREHEVLHQSLIDRVSLSQVAAETSCISENNCAHNNYINPIKKICSGIASKGFQESVVDHSEPEDRASMPGMQHINLSMVLQSASERYRERLPTVSRPMSWEDVIETSHQLLPDLQISQALWGEACALLGRAGAAICVLLTDRGLLRETGRVRRPAAYFHGMLNRARAGELRLHNSVYGLIGSG